MQLVIASAGDPSSDLSGNKLLFVFCKDGLVGTVPVFEGC